MRNKTMTIPQFLEMTRVKEFNRKRKSKRNKQILFVIALIAILIALNNYSIDLSNNAATAFIWSELQC